MLKPLTDKHKQFEDIRTFLGNAPAATEFIDVRDFVMQLGGGVHEHYRVRALYRLFHSESFLGVESPLHVASVWICLVYHTSHIVALVVGRVL